METSQHHPEDHKRQAPISAEIGENVEHFATRLLRVLEKTQCTEVHGRYGQVDLKVVPGTTVQDVLEAYQKGNVPQPKRTSSGIVVLSPQIGENTYEFIKTAFDRAVSENTPIAIESDGVTFVIDPQRRKVIFGRVNYHLDPKMPITFEDVMGYLKSVIDFRRR